MAFNDYQAILCGYNRELLVFVKGSCRELTLLGTLLPAHFDASMLLPLALCLQSDMPAFESWYRLMEVTSSWTVEVHPQLLI